MLGILHRERAGTADACAPRCASHACFGYEFFDWAVCTVCGSTSEPVAGRDFVLRLYASELIAAAEKCGAGARLTDAERVVSRASSGESCPGLDQVPGCLGRARAERYCLSLPLVLAVCVVWPGGASSQDEIYRVLSLLGDASMEEAPAIDAAALFRVALRARGGAVPYRLRAISCFYGRHYVAFVRGARAWLLLDDGAVRHVPDGWRGVHERCVRGRLQVTMMFWECEDAAAAAAVGDDGRRSPATTGAVVATAAATEASASGSFSVRHPAGDAAPGAATAAPGAASDEEFAVATPTATGLPLWHVELGARGERKVPPAPEPAAHANARGGHVVAAAAAMAGEGERTCAMRPCDRGGENWSLGLKCETMRLAAAGDGSKMVVRTVVTSVEPWAAAAAAHAGVSGGCPRRELRDAASC